MPLAVNTGTHVIDRLDDLLDVKEEEVETCFHTLVDHNKVEWPYYRDLSVSSWAGNESIGNDAVNEVIQSSSSIGT